MRAKRLMYPIFEGYTRKEFAAHMVGAKSGSRLLVHGFRGRHGAFPSFYGNNRVVRVFRVQKDGFVKRLCHSHIAARRLARLQTRPLNMEGLFSHFPIYYGRVPI